MILLENIPKEINKAQYSGDHLPAPQSYISLKDAYRMSVTHCEGIGKRVNSQQNTVNEQKHIPPHSNVHFNRNLTLSRII